MKEHSKQKLYSKNDKRYSYRDLIKKSAFIFPIGFLIGAIAMVIYILKDLFI